MEDCVVEGFVERYAGGDDSKLLEDASELYKMVCCRFVAWSDPSDTFARKKLQMIIDYAEGRSVPLHHNLAQRFGIAFPETELPS